MIVLKYQIQTKIKSQELYDHTCHVVTPNFLIRVLGKQEIEQIFHYCHPIDSLLQVPLHFGDQWLTIIHIPFINPIAADYYKFVFIASLILFNIGFANY